MSALSDLQTARTAIADAADPMALVLAIEDALRPPAPTGTPSVISDRAGEYNRAAQDADGVGQDLRRVARDALPGAWRGAAAESAEQAVDALGREVQNTMTVLQRAAVALHRWADDLTTAQGQDRQGCETLASAAMQLGFPWIDPSHLPAAKSQALEGAQARIAATQLAQESGSRTASALRELSS
jgi:uncharacterized protein YukE